MKHFFIFKIQMFILFGLINHAYCQTDRQKYDNFVSEKKLKASEKFTYSQFAIALRYKDTLQLNTSQIDSMYLEVPNIKTLKHTPYQENGESLDTRAIESSKMINLLTASQYDLLLRLKNQRKAKNFAETDWKEMELRNLTTTFDKLQTIELLYEYYVVRESLYDKYRHDPLQQSIFAKAHFSERPTALKTLAKARKSNQNSTLGTNLNGN